MDGRRQKAWSHQEPAGFASLTSNCSPRSRSLGNFAIAWFTRSMFDRPLLRATGAAATAANPLPSRQSGLGSQSTTHATDRQRDAEGKRVFVGVDIEGSSIGKKKK